MNLALIIDPFFRILLGPFGFFFDGEKFKVLDNLFPLFLLGLVIVIAVKVENPVARKILATFVLILWFVFGVFSIGPV